MSKGRSVEYRLPSVDEIEEDTSFIGDVLAYMNSPEGELFLEVAKSYRSCSNKPVSMRKGVRSSGTTANGSRLLHQRSALESSIREYPLDIIEQNVVIWLESEFAPPTYTPEQFDELDRLTQAWIQDHKRQAKRAEKRSRTRHS